MHSLEPDETPSYSASHLASNYVQRSLLSQTWCEDDDISVYRNRTGTGNKLNLIMRMTVLTFLRLLRPRPLFVIVQH